MLLQNTHCALTYQKALLFKVKIIQEASQVDIIDCFYFYSCLFHVSGWRHIFAT